MTKLADTMTNQQPKPKTERKPARMKDVAVPRTDMPEYVKAEDLQLVSPTPFTIFNVSGPHPGRFGQRYKFGVAWKENGQVVKKVLTLTENDERRELAFQVRKHGAITNCRIVEIQLGGGQTYWKILDNDEPLPDQVRSDDAPPIADDDIPF